MKINSANIIINYCFTIINLKLHQILFPKCKLLNKLPRKLKQNTELKRE